jgi:hypothetical protein
VMADCMFAQPSRRFVFLVHLCLAVASVIWIPRGI